MLRFIFVVLTAVFPMQAMANMVCDDKDGDICVDVVHSDDEAVFYGISHFEAMPVTLSFELEMDNLELSKGTLDPIVLSAGERRELFTLRAEADGTWSYNYIYNWSRGDIHAEHDESYRYAMPFDPDERFYVTQSCNGDFSHYDAQAYAIDFGMPEGTAIYAARSGKVVLVVEKYDEGGPGPEYQAYGNEVSIQHKDGTIGIYYHLQYNGAAVDVGDYVEVGEFIGFSGNTGQSTGPHLHFTVTKGGVGRSDESVRITFATPNGAVTCPTEGRLFPPLRRFSRSVHRNRR